MRARLSTVTQQAQQREMKAPAAECPAGEAERAERVERHTAALDMAQREISALKEQLAQAEASTAWRTPMHACTLLVLQHSSAAYSASRSPSAACWGSHRRHSLHHWLPLGTSILSAFTQGNYCVECLSTMGTTG